MLLAFDTATPLVTVALHDGDDVVVEQEATQPMKHGEQLAPLIESVLASGGVTPGQLTSVAVGVGPGPFTGLRVGLVTARTFGLALGVPVHGVCTLDVIAAEVAATGLDVDFVVATDARRKEVYVASYDAAGRRLEGPGVLKPEVAATRAPVAGAGPAIYPESFPHSIGPDRPSAGWLARAVIGGDVDLLDPDPLYLRRPDAVAGAPRKPAS